MAVTASTSNPAALLGKIRVATKDGGIQTWHWVQENFLTHSPSQWTNRAFFRPQIQHGALVFYIWPPEGEKVSAEDYAIYHGRLIEMLLAHFDHEFSQAFASAQPITGDSIGA